MSEFTEEETNQIRKTVQEICKLHQGNLTVSEIQEELKKKVQAVTEDSEQQKKPPDLERYRLNGKRGCVLIISNGFKGIRGERVKASKADLRLMYKLWVDKDMLGCDLHGVNKKTEAHQQPGTSQQQNSTEYETFGHSDVSGKKIMSLVESLAKTQRDYSYVVVIISTHGELVSESFIQECEQLESKDGTKPVWKQACNLHDQYIKAKTEKEKKQEPKEHLVPVLYGNDWIPVREAKITESFYNEQSPNWREKPKLFILDYCRTEGKQETSKKENREPREDPGGNIIYKHLMPVMSDMIKAYATHHLFPAYNVSSGSWLIKCIARVFRHYYKEKSVVEMLTMVNSEVIKLCKEHEESYLESNAGDQYERVAPSLFESSLVKDFRLYDGPQLIINLIYNLNYNLTKIANVCDSKTFQRLSLISKFLEGKSESISGENPTRSENVQGPQ